MIVSIERKLAGVIQSSNKGKVHVIAKDHCKKMNALIGSGLQSDIVYIVSLLRKHVHELWERYDAIPNLDRVAMDITQVLLCFMGYGVQDEINDGTSGILRKSGGNGNNDDSISIGRPLACNLLCLEADSDGTCDMKLVDPGGIISESLVGRAIGRGSDKANTLLREKWRDDLTIDDLEEISLNIIRETVLEENLLSDNEKEQACVVCEVVNGEGLTVKRLPFLPVKADKRQ